MFSTDMEINRRDIIQFTEQPAPNTDGRHRMNILFLIGILYALWINRNCIQNSLPFAAIIREPMSFPIYLPKLECTETIH